MSPSIAARCRPDPRAMMASEEQPPGICTPSRPLAASLTFHPGQALGTVDADELGVLVDLLAGQPRRLDLQGRCTALSDRWQDRRTRRTRPRSRDLPRPPAHPDAGPACRSRSGRMCFVEGHDREVARSTFRMCSHSLRIISSMISTHLGRGPEGGLHVDLGEFRLAVGTQVFVAETDDLVAGRSRTSSATA